MKRFLFLTIAAMMVLMFAAAAHAQMTLRVSHTLEPSSHFNKGLIKLDELLKQKTNGELSLDIYPSAQLGSEREAIKKVSMGTLEMTLCSSAPLSNFVKSFMVFDLPFIVQDRVKAYAWMDGPEGRKILASLSGKNMIGLSIWENGFRHLSNSQRAVVTPEDIKGLKIRLMENPVHLATFRQLGVYPTAMPFDELFSSMQHKKVDGQENPLVIISTSKFYEVQKYLALSGHFYSPAILIINKDVWEKKMSREQRAIMAECVAEACAWERAYSAEMDAKLVSELASKGMVISTPDKAAWSKVVAPVYAQFEGTIGKAVIQSLINAQK